jgi:hypothetical protein
MMLNYSTHYTDRGIDNWMLKWCTEPDERCHYDDMSDEESDVTDHLDTIDLMDQLPMKNQSFAAATTHTSHLNADRDSCIGGIEAQSSEEMLREQTALLSDSEFETGYERRHGKRKHTPVGRSPTRPHIHIAAIDNGLAFPWKHPDEWRSYPYGWLKLPRSLLDRPFSERTRKMLLPLLTSRNWWRCTTIELQRLFQQDEDFNQGMFDRQLSMLKGQAWNLVKSLREPSDGPLQLCARVAAVVIEEDVQIDEDELISKLVARQDRLGQSSSSTNTNVTQRSRSDTTRALRNVRSTRSLRNSRSTSSMRQRSSNQAGNTRRQTVRHPNLLTCFRPCFTCC